MCAVALRRSRPRPLALVRGARKLAFPSFIKPCDPSLRETAPRGKDWLYEIKADGYRAQVHLRAGEVTIYSRAGLGWTREFARIAEPTRSIKAREAVIDGEAVVYGATGLPDFEALRLELGRHATGRLRYHAFDLLYLDGYDLRNVAYVERKALLAKLIAGVPEPFLFVEYLEGEGQDIFDAACKMGLEGIITKRRDAPYRSGRQDSWIKLKCVRSDTFPIVAFVEKLGAKPRKIASLYVGKNENGKLLYAGKVRTGYTESVAREVRERLDPLILTKISPARKYPAALAGRGGAKQRSARGLLAQSGETGIALSRQPAAQAGPTQPWHNLLSHGLSATDPKQRTSAAD